MARPIDPQKWREWRQRIERFEKKRQSLAGFCRREGVTTAAFYQWRKRLACAAADRKEGKAPTPSGFKPVQLLTSASVAVHLPGGTRLDVPTADRQAVELILSVLARLDAQRAGGVPC